MYGDGVTSYLLTFGVIIGLLFFTLPMLPFVFGWAWWGAVLSFSPWLFVLAFVVKRIIYGKK